MINTKVQPWTHILITGGHGYIGKNMKNYLQTEIVVSSHSVDKKKNTFTEDVTDVSNYDGIIHLSAISGIAECEEDKEQAYVDNIYATISIMNAAHKYNKPLVFASSQAAKWPMNGIYATSKWIGEQEAKRLNAKGANIKMLRFGNVYGGIGWQEKSSVVAMFRKAEEKGKSLIVNGTGEQKRDFIHVKDLCKAIWLALTCKEVCSEPIDIGTGEMVSVKEVSKMFANGKMYNKESDLVGVMENVADTILAKELLGFESEISISKESIYST